MFKVTWRGIRQHLVRFILSILAVVLGIAFVSGTFSLRTMLSSTFDSIIESSMTGDIYLRGPVVSSSGGSGDQAGGGAPTNAVRSNIPMTLADDVTSLPGVDRVVPDISGTLILVGGDGTAVSSGGAPTIGLAASVDSTLVYDQGKEPTTASEIALDSATSTKADLSLGQSTKIILDGQIRDVTVSGIFTFDAPAAGAVIVEIDKQSAIEAYAPDGTVPSIAVYVDKGASVNTVMSEIDKALPAEAKVDVASGDDVRAESQDAINQMLGFVGTFLLVFAAIALFVGGFIISNTFTMVVRQRMREIAVLRAIGASPSQVFASVVGQAAIVGVVGSAIGILGGLGLVELLRAVFSAMGMDLGGSIPLEPATVIISLVTGVIVSVVAAALPARRAATVPPVDAMRDDVQPSERSLRVRTIIGLVLFVGAIGALIGSLQGDKDGVLLGVGAAAMLVSSLVLAPIVAPWIVHVLSWPFVVALRPIGRLARGNVVRNPRRTANTAGALMIGMALVGAATVLASSTQASVASVIDNNMKSDFVVEGVSGGTIPVGALDAILAQPGVGTTSVIRGGQMVVDGDIKLFASASENFFQDAFTVTVEGGDPGALSRGEIAVKQGAATDNGWKLGDTVTLNPITATAGTQGGAAAASGGTGTGADSGAGSGAGGSAPVTAKIGLIFDTQALPSYVLPPSVANQLIPEAQQALYDVFVNAADGTSMDELRAQLTEAVKPYYVVSVMDSDEYASSLADQVNQILTILYALLGLSIVIAVLGIVNTLALSIMERTREIGLMRAVGLGRLQLSATVVIESVLISIFGAVAGLAIGVSLATVMRSVFESDGLSALVIPWGQLGVMLVIAAVVGILAALWPAGRASRLPVLEAISSE